MRSILLAGLLMMALPWATRAGIVDTVQIESKAMKTMIKCVVIRPSEVGNERPKLPVVYLLHGYSGNFSNWITRVPALAQYADSYQTIIVCPDGGFSSWYFDSPVDSTMRYETYITQDVVNYIDDHYPTIRDRKGRAITGLSMGGHGGLFLGLRHPELFGACGSMSGGINLSDVRNRYDVVKRLGDTVTHARNWTLYSVSDMIEKMPADPPKIIFDCGTEDFFYAINHALHEKMVRLKIPHDYTERPGRHDWVYWSNAVPYQLLFFNRYFNRN
jgi:S-formylglutathione hydrolase FrmB